MNYTFENPKGLENYFGNNIKNISAIIGDFPAKLPKGDIVHAIGSINDSIFDTIETVVTRHHYNAPSDKDLTLVVSYPEVAMTMIDQQTFVLNLVKTLKEFKELTFKVLLRTQSPFILGDIFSENVRVFYGDFCAIPMNQTFGVSLAKRVDVGGIAYEYPAYMREQLSNNPSEALIEQIGDKNFKDKFKK